jgi:hypothetical protein
VAASHERYHYPLGASRSLTGSALGGLVLAWAAMFVAAVFLSDVPPGAAVPAFALGISAMLAMVWMPRVWRVLMFVALLVGLLGPAAAWVVAAASLSLLVRAQALMVRYEVAPGPQLQLDRSRRRGEPASVLVVALPPNAADTRRALEVVRITDALAVRQTAGQLQLYGVLEGVAPRTIIEQRLAQAAGDVAPAFGWARFPEDGLTLEILVECAEHALSVQAAQTHPTQTFVPGSSELPLGDPIAVAHAVTTERGAT